MGDFFHFSKGRICFIRNSLVFVVNEVLSAPLLKLQNKLGKSFDTFACILLNLRRAFDSINHEILYAKLEIFVVRGSRSKWFESVFREGRQCIQVNDFSYLLVEVPQGSILGPPCFYYISTIYQVLVNFLTQFFLLTTRFFFVVKVRMSCF